MRHIFNNYLVSIITDGSLHDLIGYRFFISIKNKKNTKYHKGDDDLEAMAAMILVLQVL